jgi:hypothetical protein
VSAPSANERQVLWAHLIEALENACVELERLLAEVSEAAHSLPSVQLKLPTMEHTVRGGRVVLQASKLLMADVVANPSGHYDGNRAAELAAGFLEDASERILLVQRWRKEWLANAGE